MTPSARLLLVPRIIWAALGFSTVVYFVVLLLLSEQWEPGAGLPSDSPLPLALSAVSVATAVAIPLLRRAILGSVGISAPPPDGTAARVTKGALDDAMRRALGRYQTTTIIGCALAESIAIHGLVLAFLSQEPLAYVPGWIVCLVLMGLQFPREAGLLHALSPEERATRRDFVG